MKQRIYPNYSDNYTYNEGDDYIILKRTKSVYGGVPIFRNTIRFDTAKEAQEYFKENCGI